jgi:hypothetical protein
LKVPLPFIPYPEFVDVMGGRSTVELGPELAKQLLDPVGGLGAFDLDAANWFPVPDGYEIPGTMTARCPDDLVALIDQELLRFILVSTTSDVVLVRQR